MAKNIVVNVLKIWKSRFEHDVRTIAAIEEDTLTTLDDMFKRDITYHQLFLSFVEDAGKNWPRSDKTSGHVVAGDPVGVKKAQSLRTKDDKILVPQAYWWDACRKQLSKYEFKKDGKPLMRGGKFVLKKTTGWTPSPDLMKRASAIGLQIDQVVAMKNSVNAELFIQRRKMEIAIQVEIDQNRKSGNFSEPIREMLVRILAVSGLDVNVPQVLKSRKQTVTRTVKAA
jgi:hypothetical protein